MINKIKMKALVIGVISLVLLSLSVSIIPFAYAHDGSGGNSSSESSDTGDSGSSSSSSSSNDDDDGNFWEDTWVGRAVTDATDGDGSFNWGGDNGEDGGDNGEDGGRFNTTDASAQHGDKFGNIVGQSVVDGQLVTEYACVNDFNNVVNAAGVSIERTLTPEGVCGGCTGNREDSNRNDNGNDNEDTTPPGGCIGTLMCRSPMNACGFMSITHIPCGGTCPVLPVPANPAFFGNPCTATFTENICGVDIVRTMHGTRDCNNVCHNFVLPPPIIEDCDSGITTCPVGSPYGAIFPDCDPLPSCIPGVDLECSGVTIGGGGDPEIDVGGDPEIDVDFSIVVDFNITATPRFVKRGDKSRIEWNSQNVDSCSILSTRGDSWSGEVGRRWSNNITEEVTYTLSCVRGNLELDDKSVTVRILPIWQEI